MRVLATMLCFSLTSRKTGFEKIHKQELLLLGCIARGYSVSVPHFLANWMATSMKGAKVGHVVCIGQLVTKLGRSFGLDVPQHFGSYTQLLPGMPLLVES